MAYLPLKIPPGVVRPGTVYSARGRWYSTQLVRWFEGSMQPFGGWQRLKDSDDADVALGGPARGVAAWRDNAGTPHIAFGLSDTLYEFHLGTLTDITPVGFTAGQADASQSSGSYNNGAYGSGAYGGGDTSQVTITEAQTWQFDTFGEDLVAVAYSDGHIYHWEKSAGGAAAALSNAPTGCAAVVVTPERFVVALGAGGDGRYLQWSDQEQATSWDLTDPTTQAGDFTLPGSGRLVAGRRSRTETLLWTDTGLFAMRYIGGVLVYSFQELGSGCGAISRRSMVVQGERAIWMGHHAFHGYDGYVQTLPSAVADYVFSDLNRTKASKIWAETRSEFSEVIWHYCSAGAKENDRYVAYNYELQVWYIGQLERVGGVDRGALDTPLAVDSLGAVYQHEFGTSYLDTDGATDLVPSAESGPIEIGEGDRLYSIRQIIPDEQTLGDLSLTLLAGNYPNAKESMHGPYSAADPTSVRVTTRQVRLKVSQVNPGWRLGTPRLEAVLSGRR